MITYTGVGSRETPTDILRSMKKWAISCAVRGLILRSGGARGADTAFGRGCDSVNGQKEIYLPHKGFNSNESPLFDIAKQIHPVWERLSPMEKKLMARNVLQILGKDLQTPSLFVVCWTGDGYNGKRGKYTERTGGTGMAIELASRNMIPVFNLSNKQDATDLNDFIKENANVVDGYMEERKSS